MPTTMNSYQLSRIIVNMFPNNQASSYHIFMPALFNFGKKYRLFWSVRYFVAPLRPDPKQLESRSDSLRVQFDVLGGFFGKSNLIIREFL